MKIIRFLFNSSCLIPLLWGLVPTTLLAESAIPTESASAPLNQYRHLDWISPADIAAMPPDQRPLHRGICDGYYQQPEFADQEIENAEIKASAENFGTLPDGTNILSGDVLVTQGARTLRSDELTLNRETRETFLSGNVEIRQPDLLVRGETAAINLNKKELDARDTEYVIHPLHVHGEAGRIYNPEQKVLILDRSTYTTCEPDDNAWSFSARRIRLNTESGWGQVKGATLRIKDIPVLYLPWWTFPIDDRRQTGFLFPFIGSGENGLDFSLPYYINIAPNLDATLTPRFLADRGEMLETEFRYLSPHTAGEIGLGYLTDDQITQEKRYLLTWNHLGGYGPWKNQVDYTRVSDSDYFLDLDTTLSAAASTHLAQRFSVNRYGDHWNFSVMAQQFQTIDDIIVDEDLPYRMLPRIRLDGRFPVADTPILFTLGTETTYFDHPENIELGPTTAQRIVLNPSVQVSLQNSWGFFTPTLAFNSRYYALNQAGLTDDESTFDIPVFSLDTGIFLDRHIQWQNREFIQTLEPRLFYLYAPFEEQNQLPIFDTAKTSFSYEQLFRTNRFTGNDRIGDAKQMSLGLTTRLMDSSSGDQLLKLSVGQIIYWQDRRVQLSVNDAPETTRLSPIVSRLDWQLNQAINWRFETQWDSEENNLDSFVTGVQIRDPDNNIINFTYNNYDNGAVTADPNSEKIKQTDFSFVANIAPRWSLLGRWGYDLTEHRAFDTIFGAEYESCCWRVRLVGRRYLKESNDEETLVEASKLIMLNFELKGLGGFGGSVDSVLDESISGYRQREDGRMEPFAY